MISDWGWAKICTHKSYGIQGLFPMPAFTSWNSILRIESTDFNWFPIKVEKELFNGESCPAVTELPTNDIINITCLSGFFILPRIFF